jgi:hypothetical protein
MRYFFILILVFGINTLFAEEKQVIVPYTLADRDRAIKTEVRIGALESKIVDLDNKIEDLNKRFDLMNSKIDRLEDKFDQYFIWAFGLLLVSIFGLVGFIIYDRRAVLAPIENKTERIINVLKDAAEQNPLMKDSIRRNSL